MGRYPRSCDEVLSEINTRHESHIKSGWKPLAVDENAILYRLVKADNIDFNTKKPQRSDFDNYGLSVYVSSSNFPEINIAEILDEKSNFVGVVSISASLVVEMGFEILHDPHESKTGELQHPNHAQVVCKKTDSKKKLLRDKCEWVICPDLSELEDSN